MFDQSGTYLAVGGSDIRVYICKQWSEVLNFTGMKTKKKVNSLSRFSTSMHVTFTPDLFLFNHRPYRIGDWGGLWRECPVPDVYSNGQKPQILQFVKK